MTRMNTPPPLPRDAENRRVERRRRISARVDLVPLLDGEGQPSKGSPRCGVTHDISCQGALLSGVGYLPVGALVRVVVCLADEPDDPICCNARVARCDLTDHPRYGLKFIGLGFADAQRIRRLLASRASSSAPSWNYRFSS
jgi:hypothetical protein